MRLLRLTTVYERYLREFYRRMPELRHATHAEQRAALDRDAFGWADFWDEALRPRGYEVRDVPINARHLQEAWARERLGPSKASASLAEVALAQAKEFRPDVVWLDVADDALIRAIRVEVPSVRFVLGWMGSLLPDGPAWHETDLMLSCAPEIVSILGERGHRAAHLHHGYDPRVETRIVSREKRWDVSFVGQIPTGEATHSKRALLLDRIRRESNVAIFSPDGSIPAREAVKARLRGVAGSVGRGLLSAGLPERALQRIPKLARAALDRPAAARGLPRGLKRAIRPPVFGLAMFQVLHDSHATLNVHADFSPRFAGNMRLFEATGMGTCLVTDWKENLGELFELDREVVSFRNADELSEKLRWLAANPKARAAIGEAGHRRTLQDHTFARRAERLDALIREGLR